ncbi:MAG: hypothetical protein J6O13_16925 [Selenomonas sp.]|nr:hypothetical protein [Selenomonas sp.]
MMYWKIPHAPPAVSSALVDADRSKRSQVALVVSVHQSRNAAGRAKRRLTFDLSAAHLASFYAALL